eukprot:COSAG01_NODE_16787_length_1204_cov_3.423529_1_plen_178_part_00
MARPPVGPSRCRRGRPCGSNASPCHHSHASTRAPQGLTRATPDQGCPHGNAFSRIRCRWWAAPAGSHAHPATQRRWVAASPAGCATTTRAALMARPPLHLLPAGGAPPRTTRPTQLDSRTTSRTPHWGPMPMTARWAAPHGSAPTLVHTAGCGLPERVQHLAQPSTAAPSHHEPRRV